jgi:WD40 repeat protein
VRWSHDGNHLTLTREIDGDVDGDFPAYETFIFDSNLNVVSQSLKHLNNIVVWSQDSTRFAIPQRNGFKVWTRDGQLILTVPSGAPDYKTYTESLAWVSDSQRIVTLQETGRIQIWNVTDGTLFFQYDHPNEQEEIASIESSPDGNKLATGMYNGNVLIRDSASFQVNSVLTGHTSPVYKLKWRGNRLLTASDGITSHIWDIVNLSKIFIFGNVGSNDLISPNSDFSKFITNGESNTILLYDTLNGQELSRFQNIIGDTVEGAWTPNGSQIVVPGEDELIFFDATSGAQIQRIQANLISSPPNVVWSPNGTF